uniref:Uncharacterized protein n=1 Tax=Phalansterium sp. PJK-2012 TaxID=1267188 RepID=T1QE59_9EUKA|nr:hypothetical protein [Phalansterium sp. PJK-2012]
MIEETKAQNAMVNAGLASPALLNKYSTIEIATIILPTSVSVKYLVPGSLLTGIYFFPYSNNNLVSTAINKLYDYFIHDRHPITGVAVGGRDVRLGTRDTHSPFVPSGTLVIEGNPASAIKFRPSNQTVNPLTTYVNNAKPHLSYNEQKRRDPTLDVWYNERSTAEAAEMQVRHSLPFNLLGHIYNNTYSRNYFGSTQLSAIHTSILINDKVFTGDRTFLIHGSSNNANRMFTKLDAALTPILPGSRTHTERLEDIQKNIYDMPNTLYPGVRGNKAEVLGMSRSMAVIESRVLATIDRMFGPRKRIDHILYEFDEPVPGAKMEAFKNGIGKKFVVGHESHTSAEAGDYVAVNSVVSGVLDPITNNFTPTHLSFIKASTTDMKQIERCLSIRPSVTPLADTMGQAIENFKKIQDVIVK